VDVEGRHRRYKVKTCLVSGKFKVLHTGHLRLFHAGAELGDRLIVAIDGSGVSSEELELRRQLISNLGLVDETHVFEGDVVELIRNLRPDIVLKGLEFSRQDNPEEEVLKSFGGKLLFSSGTSLNDHLAMPGSTASLQHAFEFMSRRGISSSSLRSLVEEFSKVRVIVIGDLIVDQYHQCKALGMSQEYPNVVLNPIDSKMFLGGAAIVAAHCKGLGAATTFISVVGSDGPAAWAISELEKIGVDFHPIFEETRKTTLKERFRVGSQMMMRLNHFSHDLLAIQTEKELERLLNSLTPNFDVVIFSDFSYGLLSRDLAGRLVHIARKGGLLTIADSQSSSQIGSLSKFAGCDVITPTEREARLETKDETSGLVVLAEKLRTTVGTNSVLLKLGEAGLFLHSFDENLGTHIENDEVPALNPNPVETSGAGDSLLATVALSLGSGSDLYTSAYLGSVAAAVHISQEGNLPISQAQLVENI
jgi:rfaE bifunctional protein kinase chain/domain